jgi:hypothetical protein
VRRASTHGTAGAVDTTGPIIDLRGRRAVWLQLWTRHYGSTFTREQNGVIQFSGDSGRTWSNVAMIVGDGPNWYPVRVDLPQAADRRGAQVRFISNQFTWWLDAVGIASDATSAFAPLAAAAEAEVSENPVRSDQVVISWPATVSSARVSVFTFTGERLLEATVAAPSNEYVWDLTLDGGTRRVVNGGYVVVVDVDGQRYRRRLFVARPAPGAGGVGVDLVEVARARVLARARTSSTGCLPRRRPMSVATRSGRYVAVRLAAKEAVYKALQGSEGGAGLVGATSGDPRLTVGLTSN